MIITRSISSPSTFSWMNWNFRWKNYRRVGREEMNHLLAYTAGEPHHGFQAQHRRRWAQWSCGGLSSSPCPAHLIKLQWFEFGESVVVGFQAQHRHGWARHAQLWWFKILTCSSAVVWVPRRALTPPRDMSSNSRTRRPLIDHLGEAAVVLSRSRHWRKLDCICNQESCIYASGSCIYVSVWVCPQTFQISRFLF